MSKKFQRKKEDFVCEHCGSVTRGDGYTNHCSNCLWSKHVDVFPGDRSEECGGLMEPMGIRIKHGETALVHRCVKCKIERNVRTSPDDNREEIIRLSGS